MNFSKDNRLSQWRDTLTTGDGAYNMMSIKQSKNFISCPYCLSKPYVKFNEKKEVSLKCKCFTDADPEKYQPLEIAKTKWNDFMEKHHKTAKWK